MIPIPSRHLLITLAIVAASFFLLLWANERYDSYVSARESRAETEWKAAKKNWELVHKRIKTTLAEVAHADSLITIERGKSSRAMRVADSLRRARAWIPVPEYADSTNPRWRALYFSAAREADSLRSVHHYDSTALFGALTSRDSLRAVLLSADTAGTRVVASGQKLIDAKSCKILWLIECPSRRVVAVVSGAIGLAAGAYVERQHSKRPPAPVSSSAKLYRY
jgi:hypothetical protein